MPPAKVIPIKGGPAPKVKPAPAAIQEAPNGSDLKKQFKAMDLRCKLAELKRHLSLGHADHVIAADLGVGTTVYNNLKRELYRQETGTLIGKTTEDVYLEYKWAQEKCIRDLDKVIGQLENTSQHNALVGLIRARSDIVDKIIKTGQEMGVVEKEPDRKLVIHGHAIAALNDAELKKTIVAELSGLGQMLKKYGDKDMMGNPLSGDGTEASPEVLPQLHAGPKFGGKSRPGQAMSGPTKAAAAKKSRQAVKRTKVVDSSH